MMSSNPVSSVCIVGAGISGLAAIKECISLGLKPTCFDLDYKLGGTWHRKAPGEPSNTPSLWDSLILNSSKYNSTFSDFPCDPKDPPYMSPQALAAYFDRLVDHFGLARYVQLNTRVMKIRKTPDHNDTGRWEVYTCSSKDPVAGDATPGPRGGDEILSRCQKYVFDKVIVCTGYFKIPKYPDNIPLNTFDGEISHAHTFRDGYRFKGKRVLVVGNHFSAGDVVTEVANHASQTYLAVGQGTWVLPRAFPGRWPIDCRFTRSLIYGCNHEIRLNDMVLSWAEGHLDHKGCGIGPAKPLTKASFVISDYLPVRIQAGEVKVYAELVNLTGRAAQFRDGTVIPDLDAVIFCTGYRPDLSFLDLKVMQDNYKVDWYKMTFPVGQPRNTLALVGLFGTEVPLIALLETQARFATMVLADKVKLPSQKKMQADADHWNTEQLAKKENYNYTVPGYNLQDDFALECGFYPSVWKIALRDPLLAWRVWFGPILVAHFRLLGPGSDWDKARATIYSYYNEGLKSVQVVDGKDVYRHDVAARNKRRALTLVALGALVAGGIALYCRGD